MLLVTAVARAECTKDTDCKGDRICEGGACVAPSAALPPPPAPPPGVGAPEGAPASPTANPTAAPPLAGTTHAGAMTHEELAAPRAAQTTPLARQPPEDAQPLRMKRHSTGMMAGGIVMVSLSPIAFLVAAVADAEQTSCEARASAYASSGVGFGSELYGRDCEDYDSTIYGGLLSGLALAGVGIPLIVIGARKEPDLGPTGVATISPWLTRHAAGLGLRLEL